jgi:serine protease Do|tara:strand:+ start:4276 stop:5679 length:1404 start_codon:yes stop_codon:yes gene_type:complete
MRYLSFKLFIVLLAFFSNLNAIELPDFSVIAEEQGNTVVNISVINESQTNQNINLSKEDQQLQEFLKRFGIPGFPGMMPPGSERQKKPASGTGSGFIIESDGYIITNAHVVFQAETVVVKLADKREFNAEVIGLDRRTDVALLKIKAKNLPKVTIGNSDLIKVGQWVAAIGSPFGLENTMTVGVISAINRALPQENFVPFIQTDVAINPGNSGGPLFDTKGHVIGINSQIYSKTGGSMGLSFAIPIDVAINVAEQIKTNGKVIRGWLGIVIQEITQELSESFGMTNKNGALIAGVEKNSPAAKGGLLPGDVILKFNKNIINTSSDLPKFVGITKPKTRVPVEILRKGKVITLNIKVGTIPSKEKFSDSRIKNQPSRFNRLGLALKNLSVEQKKEIGGRNGLFVSDLKGPALTAGILKGDIILVVNNTPVRSIQSFNNDLRKIPKGKVIAILLYRNGDTLFVPVKVGK